VKLVCDSVTVFIYRHSAAGTQYLLMQRTESRGGFWQPVSGTIKEDESPTHTARREAAEETGIELGELTVLQTVHMFVKPEKRRLHFEPCFAMEAVAGEVYLSKEHTQYEWLGYTAAHERLPFMGLRDALSELQEKLRRDG